MALDDKVAALVNMYKVLTRRVLPGFLANPSADNLEIRDQILSPSGDPMVNATPGVARHQLLYNIEGARKALRGEIDPGDFYKLQRHEHQNPKPIVDEQVYRAYGKEKQLSPEGERLFYVRMLNNKVIQTELDTILKAKEPEKYKEFSEELEFAGMINAALAQGKIEEALAYIAKEKGGAEIAALARDHLRYGSPQDAAIIANKVAYAAQQRAFALYDNTKGGIQSAVDAAIEKTGTLGYTEAIINWEDMYNSDSEKQYQEDTKEAKRLGKKLEELRAMREKKAAEEKVKEALKKGA